MPGMPADGGGRGCWKEKTMKKYKVAVIPGGEIGWVAEGDYSHYFID